jgi:hypothetical protein
MRQACVLVVITMVSGIPLRAQSPPPVGPVDVMQLAQIKDFTAHRVSSNNPDPDSNDDSLRPIPGETVVLADLTGPGMVTHIWLTVAANEYAWPRLLRLRVYYDGSSTPSVDAPIGDFFGVGHGLERPLSSLLVRDSSSGRSRNSYWPMPFRQRCRITVTNEGGRRVSNLYFQVDWQKMPSLPEGTAYFHARYRQALPAAMGKPLEILNVKGRGHYVGTVFSVVQVGAGWFGEGDDHFYVDGKEQADLEGTGTEDYFNDAWSFRVTEGPYTGVTVADGTGVGARMSAYRWHAVDPVPFTTSLRVEMEHAGWTYAADGSVRSAFEERPDLFSTVAFWYQLGIAGDQPEPPYGSARLPMGNARQIEVENLLAEVTATGGKLTVQRDVFWSKDLLVFEAAGAGSRIDVPLDVPEDGTYEVIAQMGLSADYGVYAVFLDGKPTGESEVLEHEPGANTGAGAAGIDSYYLETFVGEDRLLGWRTLTKGRHTVSFICQGKNALSSNYLLGLDTLVLARVASAEHPGLNTASATDRADALRRIGARGASSADIKALIEALGASDDGVREAAAWSLTQSGGAAGPAAPALIRSMEDPDPVVRGLAALALRDVNPAASAPALATLTAHLSDTDENVRMMSAQAVGRQGPRAKGAISALIAASQVPGQHPHVLRSVADALGLIGPDARAALPALRELWKIPRVRWAADLAIRRIEARP